jgi:hypothetical protein
MAALQHRALFSPAPLQQAVLTLSNSLFLIRTILHHTEAVRWSNLTLFHGQVFEIGPGVIIVPLLSPPLTFERFFRQVMMMLCSGWLTESVRGSHSRSPRFPQYDRSVPTISPRALYGEQSLLTVTDAGCASIESFPVDALEDRMMNRLSEQAVLPEAAGTCKRPRRLLLPPPCASCPISGDAVRFLQHVIDCVHSSLSTSTTE